MKNDSLFVWQPALTAPKYYPVQAQYARVMVGKDMNISMGETFVGYGVGNGVSLIDFDAAFGGLEIPTGLDILWLSLTGIYINSIVCDSLQGEEVKMSLKDFDKDYYEAFKTLDSLCASGLSDFDGATENLKVNGIPLGLWDKYAKRYPYEIKITFEDKRAIIIAESPRSMEFGVRTICYFPTGEEYDLKATKGIKDMAALKKMHLSWYVDDIDYTGEFFFDESEILKVYPELFGATGQMKPSVLNIEVSKYNNRFKISLVSGEKSYQLKDTKIHVFSKRQDEEDSSS